MRSGVSLHKVPALELDHGFFFFFFFVMSHFFFPLTCYCVSGRTVVTCCRMVRFGEGVQCSRVGTACESETTLALRGCETQRGCVVGKQPNMYLGCNMFLPSGERLVIACEWWLCSFVQTATSALLGTAGGTAAGTQSRTTRDDGNLQGVGLALGARRNPR